MMTSPTLNTTECNLNQSHLATTNYVVLAFLTPRRRMTSPGGLRRPIALTYVTGDGSSTNHVVPIIGRLSVTDPVDIDRRCAGSLATLSGVPCTQTPARGNEVAHDVNPALSATPVQRQFSANRVQRGSRLLPAPNAASG